ncbi:MAG: hypothetical protein ACE5LU_24515 [Anaerolineae bacterium]
MKVRLLFAVLILIMSLSLLLTSAGAVRGKDGPADLSAVPACLRATHRPAQAGKGVVQQPAEKVELIGQIGGETYAVAVQGNYAYIGLGPRLVVLDVSHPANPTVVGQTDLLLPGVTDVVVERNYAYVATGEALHIVDVTNPTDSDGLHIIDVTNPDSPIRVGFYDMPGYSYGVAVAGNYAYVAASGQWNGNELVGHGLYFIDVTNPAAPTERGYYQDYRPPTIWTVRGWIAVAGNHAYVARSGGGLRIIDVTNPAAPTEVGSYHPPTQGAAADVAVAGNYAYVAGGGDGLRIIDVADPATPFEVGFNATLGGSRRVAVEGNYAYLAGSDSLYIIDVANPTSPTRVGFYDTPALAQGVYVAGNYAYLAEWMGWDGSKYVGGGLSIVDISNPAIPTGVGFYRRPGWSDDVAVEGNYAYLAADNSYPNSAKNGLHIIDITNPTSPSKAGFYRVPTGASGVAVRGSYAYLPNEEGLHIIDVADPATPFEVGFYHRPYFNYDVAVEGNYAYLAAQDGLYIIDVTNPTSPTKAGFYLIQGLAVGVAVEGSYAYVADRTAGLVIFHFRFAPISASVPTSGGSLTSSSDQTNYTFASGTFTDTVTITHAPRFSDNVPSTGNPSTGSGRRLAGIDHFFEVDAVYSNTGQPAQPTQPYTVTVQYTDSEKGPVIESTLGLYSWDGSQWVREPTSVVDIATNTVTATPDHFSLWAVLGETRRMFLPLVLRND